MRHGFEKFVVFEEVDGRRLFIDEFDSYHDAEAFLIKCIGMTSHRVGIALWGEGCESTFDPFEGIDEEAE